MRKTVNADVYSYQGIRELDVNGRTELLYFFSKNIPGHVPEYVFYPQCKYVSDKNKETIYLNPIKDKNLDRRTLDRLLKYAENRVNLV